VQPVQCGMATMANMAHVAIESLYVSESTGLPRVRIPLSPPINCCCCYDFTPSVIPVATMLPRRASICGDSSSRIALSVAPGLRCM
jgi:hypothetical protein